MKNLLNKRFLTPLFNEGEENDADVTANGEVIEPEVVKEAPVVEIGTQRVTVSVMECNVMVGDIVHPVKVMALPGASAGMAFEAYQQLEAILVKSVDEQKLKAVIDPVLKQASASVKKGINVTTILSIMNLFKGATLSTKIYHSPVKVVGTCHLSSLVRGEVEGKKIHTAILMKYVKENFMTIVSDHPELLELLMGVMGSKEAEGAMSHTSSPTKPRFT